jgi:uncharacterized RDD family membrane protein YckC
LRRRARRSAQPLGGKEMYPSILRRYLSTVIDFAVIFGLMYAFLKSPLFDAERSEPAVWFLLLIVAFEPFLTAFACTPGQLLMNLRVRSFKTLKRPSLLATTLRWIVKMLLGVISIIFIPSQKQRRGLHDLAAGTIVLNRSSPHALLPNTSLERTREG